MRVSRSMSELGVLRPASAALAVLLGACGAAAQPGAPVYTSSFVDCVTGDNAFWTGEGRFWFVDPGCDSYQVDVYERPMTQEFKLRAGNYSAKEYFEYLDITQAKVGVDNEYLYVRIDLYGRRHSTSGGDNIEVGMMERYGFRISTDPDGRYGVLIVADQPEVKNEPNTVFGPIGVSGYLDTNGDVGGAADEGPTGLTVTKSDNADEESGLNGYDAAIIQDGRLGSGPVVAWVRLDPADNTVVELALRYADLGFTKNQIMALPYFDVEAVKGGLKDPQGSHWNDKDAANECGSPNPGPGGMSEFGTDGLKNTYEADTVRAAAPGPQMRADVESVVSPAAIDQGSFGGTITPVPDVNGDGREDFAVGGAREGSGGAGRIHVYNGLNGIKLRTLATPIASDHAAFSQWVAGVPDVNGDGRGDLIVGAPGLNPGGSPADSGRAYLYSGATGAVLRGLASPTPEVGGRFGMNVLGIKDINGDGRGDVVVAAPGENPGASPVDAGRVHVFSGASGARIRTLASPYPQANEFFGRSLAVVPDANADGRDDILVGAPRGAVNIPGQPSAGPAPASSGRAYLFSGATGSLLRVFWSPVHASEAQGLFGASVAGVRDVDGDGRGDVVVGAPFEDPGTLPADAGRVYVFSGATGTLIRAHSSPTPEAGGVFGLSLAGVPDINADGRGEIAVGAFSLDPGTAPAGAGRLHLFSGANGLRLHTFASPYQAAQGAFGAGVCGLKDVNGNGRGELVVGATGEASCGTPSAGQTYLIKY